MNDDDKDVTSGTTNTERFACILKLIEKQNVDKNLDSINETELQIQDNSEGNQLSNSDRDKPSDWLWNKTANEGESDLEE